MEVEKMEEIKMWRATRGRCNEKEEERVRSERDKMRGRFDSRLVDSLFSLIFFISFLSLFSSRN